MLDFSQQYKQLPEEDRISLTNKIASTIESLNLVNYPAISTYLNTAEGRLVLLKTIANGITEDLNLGVMDIVNNIENLS